MTYTSREELCKVLGSLVLVRNGVLIPTIPRGQNITCDAVAARVLFSLVRATSQSLQAVAS